MSSVINTDSITDNESYTTSTAELEQLAALEKLKGFFYKQKNSFTHETVSNYRQRIEALIRLKSALLENSQVLMDALNEDYGHRSQQDSLMADILPSINLIKDTLKNLKRWMKPSKRRAGLLLAPASVHVHYQPLGVIGIMVPWNFPITLSLGPLIQAVSAGNRVMIKLSEFTPVTNKVLSRMLTEVFSSDEVVCIEGNVEIASQFSQLPFDHLFFTGSTTVGRHVMAAASKNLTPVTLELGGKSPVIITDDMSIDIAVERLIFGKCLNAGQICIAPDYVFVPQGKEQDFIKSYQKRFQEMYGSVSQNKDYSSIINQKQFTRLMNFLDDAKAKGAVVLSAHDEPIDLESRKIPTQLIYHVNDDMLVMQDEIFGPLLPIVTYQTIEEVLDYIKSKPRPLALYVMSFDSKIQDYISENTHSGGMCINDTMLHVADDAPFGGIGASGMGQYHGREGFLTFSHAKTIVKRGKISFGKLTQPPYQRAIHRFIKNLLLR